MGHLPVDWAYGLLYTSLFCFVALVICYELHGGKRSGEALKGALLHPNEDHIASGGQHGWLSIGLSLFASLAGNWLLFLPADVGASYSWPGVLGYALGVSMPYILLVWLSPTVKRLTLETGFSGTDYLLIRYGRFVQVIFAGISVVTMLLSFAVELTTIGTTFRAITGQKFPAAHAILPVALVTLLYTLYGGLRTSILTDKYQGCLIVLLSVPVVAATFATTASTDSSWWLLAKAPSSPVGCYVAGIVLVLSLWPVYLLDQGIWQRMWATKTPRDLNTALVLAAGLAFGSVLLFGVTGMACRRAAGTYGQPTVFGFLADSLSMPWLGVITVLAVACVASSVDTYQIALASVFVRDLKSAKLSYNWARLVLLLGNAAAIALACAQLPILTLCMTSNIVCVAVSGSLLASVTRKATAVGLFCGVVAGFLAGLVCGLCSTGSFVGALQFFAPADFSSPAYLVAFTVMPLVGFSVALGVSIIHQSHRAAPAGDALTGGASNTADNGAVAATATCGATELRNATAVEHDSVSQTDV